MKKVIEIQTFLFEVEREIERENEDLEKKETLKTLLAELVRKLSDKSEN